MKFFSNKSFGYPVLQTLAQGATADTLDYPTGAFQVRLVAKLSLDCKNNFSFAYNFKTSVRGLEEAVERGDAAYFLRVKCSSTYFSQIEQAEQQSGELFIPANQLRGATEVAAFIVAIQDATIKSDQIHPDFGAKEFDVKAGMVLAYQAPLSYYIEKDYFRPITAVMEYQENDKMPQGEFTIILGEQSDEPVYVAAHPEQIKLFKLACGGDSGERSIFLNSVAFVAVMQMFRALIDDNESYKNSRWGKVLDAKYDGEINKEMDIVKATQTILKQPLRLLNERFYSPLKS